MFMWSLRSVNNHIMCLVRGLFFNVQINTFMLKMYGKTVYKRHARPCILTLSVNEPVCNVVYLQSTRCHVELVDKAPYYR